MIESYPWATAKDEDPALLRIRQEDVGYDSQGVITTSNGVGSHSKSKMSESGTEGEGGNDPLVSDV